MSALAQAAAGAALNEVKIHIPEGAQEEEQPQPTGNLQGREVKKVTPTLKYIATCLLAIGAASLGAGIFGPLGAADGCVCPRSQE